MTSFQQRIKDFFLNKLYYPLLELPLLQRVMCIWFGILGGIFPIPAVTSGATAVISAILGFNGAQSAIAVTVNLLMTPMQFILLPYFADASLLFMSNTNPEGKKPSQVIVEAFQGGDILAALSSIPYVVLAACVPWVILLILSVLGFGALARASNNTSNSQKMA